MQLSAVYLCIQDPMRMYGHLQSLTVCLPTRRSGNQAMHMYEGFANAPLNVAEALPRHCRSGSLNVMPHCLITGMLMLRNKVEMYGVHLCACVNVSSGSSILILYIFISLERHMSGFVDLQVDQETAKERERERDWGSNVFLSVKTDR